VQSLLQRNDIDPNQKSHKSTPLMIAARGGHEAVVQLLLNRDDVRTNIQDDISGWTALVHAASEGHEAVVRLLLERDDGDVKQALRAATRCGHEGVVLLLLKHGITADSRDLALQIVSGLVESSVVRPHAGHDAVIRLLRECQE
jgi:ankyrin repeat protein